MRFEPLEPRRVLAGFIVSTDADAGAGSLRDAIQMANASPGADQITFDATIPNLTIRLESELLITDSVTLDASALTQKVRLDARLGDATPLVRDGAGIRIMTIDDGNDATVSLVELRHLILSNGDVTGAGGAILSRESLSLQDVDLSANHATSFGGAVYQDASAGAVFTLANSGLSGNQSGSDGGALRLQLSAGNDALIESTYLGANRSERSGGAISAVLTDDATLQIESSSLIANSASVSGGGISSYSISAADLEMRDVTFTSNEAGDDGGGWHGRTFYYAQTNLVDAAFANNVAGARGGAVATFGTIGGTTNITQAQISGNIAGGAGGAVYSEMRAAARFELAGSIISGNDAGGSGGGVMSNSLNGGYANINTSSLFDNDGIRGGGLFVQASEGGVARVVENSIFGNTAFAGGGGAYGFGLAGGQIVMEHLTLTNNETMEELGGGIGIRTFQTAQVELSNITARSNVSRFGGGVALFLNGGDVSLDTATLEGNSADGSGGGLSVQAFGGATAAVSKVTLAGNVSSNGGGAWLIASGGTLDVVNSTVSGNTAIHYGGGIYASTTGANPDTVTLRHLTVAKNSARASATSAGAGGGIASRFSSSPTLSHVVVADNLHLGTPGDLYGNFVGDYNLVEVPEAATITGSGNLTSVDPFLLPLADNGGPTQTHAFAATSAAVDSGDPLFSGTPMFDQRGAPFSRVQMGRIDRGAIERIDVVDGDFDDDGDYDLADIDALVAEIVGDLGNPFFDLNSDGFVDLLDRDAWLTEAGEFNLGPGRAYLLGDANLDATVDGQDFLIWNTNKFTAGGLWSGGDFNADGTTDGGDFIVWNTHKFMTADTGRHEDEPESNRELPAVQDVGTVGLACARL